MCRHDINLGDIRMIAGMQVGRAYTGYRNGRFSTCHETTIHEFQRRVAMRLLGEERAAA